MTGVYQLIFYKVIKLIARIKHEHFIDILDKMVGLCHGYLRVIRFIRALIDRMIYFYWSWYLIARFIES